MFIELFPKLITLLSFAMLGTAFLLIVRRDLAGQVRIFAVQSLILAILAAVIAAFTRSIELVSDHRQSRWLEECEPLKAVGKPPAT